MKTDQINIKERRTELIWRLLTGVHFANIDVHGKPIDLQLQKIHEYDGDFHALNDYSKIISTIGLVNSETPEIIKEKQANQNHIL